LEERCRVPKCEDCGRLGHTRERCFGRRTGEGGGNGRTMGACFACGEWGHIARECTVTPREGLEGGTVPPSRGPEKDVWCYFCRVSTHGYADCTELKRHECVFCGEKGHTGRRCKSPYKH
jgi:cellular nucleic acid-binding protein